METQKNLYQRMSAVMQDVRRLQKDKQVGSGSYAYKAISEEKVATTLRTAMIEHGLVIFPVEQQHTMVDHHRADRNGVATVVSLSTVNVKYKLVNIDNPAEFEIIASSGTGVDPQDKGVGKAMTYALKYALMRAFLIPTGDDPDNIHNEELARQQQPALAAAPAAPAANEFLVARAKSQILKAKSLAELTEVWVSLAKPEQGALRADANAARTRITHQVLQAANTPA